MDGLEQKLSDLKEQVKMYTSLCRIFNNSESTMQNRMDKHYDQLDQRYASLSERMDELEMIVKQHCIDITLLKAAN